MKESLMISADQIQNMLFSLQDSSYREFQQKLIPNISAERIIGVRTPHLRKIAKQVDRDFLKELPHAYFEENLIHGFCLEAFCEPETAVSELEKFLPFVDNWAVCDQLRLSVFKQHKKQMLPNILKWVSSNHPYTVRFGIEMLMLHYLDADFDPAFPQIVSQICHTDYYVNMMIAWYFATALSKQFDRILPYLSGYVLPAWIHNKTIQKANESRCLSAEQKQILLKFKL